jgi:hypothetical protein
MPMSPPRLSLIRPAVLAVSLLAGLTAEASAEPKSIGFTKMVDGAEVIAVAHLAGKWEPGEWRIDRREGGSLELELTKILKGNLQPGRYRVRYDDRPHASQGREFVAFLGKGLCWRFGAYPLSEANTVADGVLKMVGFYDWSG